MMNLIVSQDREIVVHMGKVFIMEVANPASAKFSKLVATADTREHLVLGQFSTKEMAKDVLQDIVLWNEIDKCTSDVAPTYRVPQDKPDYNSVTDAINLPGAMAHKESMHSMYKCEAEKAGKKYEKLSEITG